MPSSGRSLTDQPGFDDVPPPLSLSPSPAPPLSVYIYTLAKKSPEKTHEATTTGILHTIFFHRFFPPVAPRSREVLDITLPYVADAELDTMIEKRADELAQQLDAERSGGGGGGAKPGSSRGLGTGIGGLAGGRGGAAAAGTAGAGTGAAAAGTGGRGGGKGGDGRGTVTVQFFEKRRRKAWYGSGRDEEVCWESWTLKVTVAEPRTESGRFLFLLLFFSFFPPALLLSVTHPSPSSFPSLPSPSPYIYILHPLDRTNQRQTDRQPDSQPDRQIDK